MKELLEEFIPKLKEEQKKLHLVIDYCNRKKVAAAPSDVSKYLQLSNAIFELDRVYKNITYDS